ncbi:MULTISPECIES: acyltransferase [Parabacteroides]|uniref:acyltransferase n=2 Tax=Parabacteroides leei TaxID=2939491 RepID=UPI00189B1916|nr:acyltransferase [Parabacteroides goldsteinii]
MELLYKIKRYEKLKPFLVWLISPKRNPKPRWWVRWFVTPFIFKKGKGAMIRSKARLDIFPWHRFSMGAYATIEDYAIVANGVGDLIIGDQVRIGVGSAVLGPVTLKSGCGLGQHVFISGFNHEYKDPNTNSKFQGLEKKPVIIEEDTHIGSNAVVVAGVHIGKRCQIGAGSVVTKDVPDYCIVGGNPARILKQYDFDKKEWIRIPKV